MGTRSCGPLGSHVPAFLDFSFVFHIPAFLFHIFSRTPVLLHSCFAFLCSCVKECLCGGWGCNSSHERCVCMDGSGGLGQLATSPLPPLVTRALCTSILVGSRFGVKHISHPHSPPSTSPLSTYHNCVISSQKRLFSVPILSCSRIPI